MKKLIIDCRWLNIKITHVYCVGTIKNYIRGGISAVQNFRQAYLLLNTINSRNKIAETLKLAWNIFSNRINQLLKSPRSFVHNWPHLLRKIDQSLRCQLPHANVATAF